MVFVWPLNGKEQADSSVACAIGTFSSSIQTSRAETKLLSRSIAATLPNSERQRCDVAEQAGAILQMRRLVSERRATKVRLENLEKVCGFSTSPFGLLADLDLRRHVDFMQAFRYDWIHCALQDGTMSVESSLLFSSA